MEPSIDTWSICEKAENMILNRFCIDEAAAFEISGVYYLERSSYQIAIQHYRYRKNLAVDTVEQDRKGKECLKLLYLLFDQLYFKLII